MALAKVLPAAASTFRLAKAVQWILLTSNKLGGVLKAAAEISESFVVCNMLGELCRRRFAFDPKGVHGMF